jgi:16S rRNA U516 pseudouridylate synthase RsuA-like enzyme
MASRPMLLEDIIPLRWDDIRDKMMGVGRTLDIDSSGAILLPDLNAYADRLGGV